MSKATDVRIKETFYSCEPIPFRVPLKFGGRVLQKSSLINVEVVVESRDGKQRASGYGSMPVGNVWSWPTEAMTAEQTEKAMLAFAEELLNLADQLNEPAHPIDLVYQLAGEYDHLGKTLAARMKYPEPLPPLAQLVAASPFDAALHDAYGRLHKKNCFDTLTSKYVSHDLSEYLDDQFKGEYLDKYTLREPRPSMPLYHLVGALDALTAADVAKKVGDGLPETLEEWIPYNGLTHLKIKLSGNDPVWDLDRILAVDAVAVKAQAARGCADWVYSLDFNEQCENAEAVVGLLKKLREKNPKAYDRVQYIEQPTHRDMTAHPERMDEVAKLKTVVIDEALLDYDALVQARDLGYTGVALKACKGHTESLLLGAAAQKFGMFLCVQDLTCPGASFLHSASLAAHLPGVAAIEGNGRQYCPTLSKSWNRDFPSMFTIKDGTVGTSVLNGPGLGF